MNTITRTGALAFGALFFIATASAQEAAPAIQPPQEVGTGSSQTLEYVRDTTVADIPVMPAPAPAAPVPAAPQTVTPDVPAAAPNVPVTETAEAPAAKPYIEIDLDLLREKMDRPRRTNYGGAGAFTPLFMMLDMAPVEELAANDPLLQEQEFDLSSGGVLLWGGMGYGGVGDGIRIGGGGWGGYTSYYSKPFASNADDTTANGALIDSVMELSVIPAFGCMTIEKGFVFDRLNLIVGGSMGAGALVVIQSTFRKDEGTAFFGEYDSTTFNEETDVAVAPLTVLGLHGGATYSLLSWMHLGADAGVNLFHSGRGFGYGFGSFNTVNPFIRMRIVFGNLG